ncbi:MAG: sugar ABC transporter permease [Firmicutes bacterium]|nr:sugar ABC transporter permease [Bacillota bacterium]
MTSRDSKAAVAFLAPALILLGFFRLWPAARSLAESLRGWSGAEARAFVGLANYRYLFQEDPVFWSSVQVTLKYAVIASPITVAAALGLAFLLRGKGRRLSFLRTLCFLPSAVSLSVMAVVWGLMLDPYYGLANSILKRLGVPPQPFLSSTNQALACLILIAVWRNAGYWMMFFLAGMESIPKEVYEASALDGASSQQQAWRITIPLLARTMSFVLVANTTFNFVTFAPVFILTRGGPIGSTNLLMYEAYKSAFVYLDPGRAMAMSSLTLLGVLILSIVQLKLARARFEC